jgi:uncharacterized protein YukE
MQASLDELMMPTIPANEQPKTLTSQTSQNKRDTEGGQGHWKKQSHTDFDKEYDLWETTASTFLDEVDWS